MRTRGRGLFIEDFYSLCSAHREWNPECKRCAAGMWHNRWVHMAGSFVYAVWPWLWRKWANRKNSPSRKFLEEHFPKLRCRSK
jgi:hypothetical protein